MSRGFKPRLRRLERLFTDSPVYYLTVCTHGRRQLLANPELHAAFIRFAREAAPRGVFVGRYVLLPDHTHFFAGFTPDSPPLSPWMKSWKNALSKTLRQSKVSAPHWQKGFFDHVMRSEESYEQKWLYVRENPVRAGLVKHWEEWPYQGEIFRLTVGKL